MRHLRMATALFVWWVEARIMTKSSLTKVSFELRTKVSILLWTDTFPAAPPQDFKGTYLYVIVMLLFNQVEHSLVLLAVYV